MVWVLALQNTGPRDAARFITRLRPTGLKVVSLPKFSTESGKLFFWWSKPRGFG